MFVILLEFNFPLPVSCNEILNSLTFSSWVSTMKKDVYGRKIFGLIRWLSTSGLPQLMLPAQVSPFSFLTQWDVRFEECGPFVLTMFCGFRCISLFRFIARVMFWQKGKNNNFHIYFSLFCLIYCEAHT